MGMPANIWYYINIYPLQPRFQLAHQCKISKPHSQNLGESMTDMLYMESIKDCYIKDFEAKVEQIEIDDKKAIILDRTAFYPLGGGQPNDIGSIRWKGGSCKVVGVIKKNKVKHIVEGDMPEIGQQVIGELDWTIRYAHMRMHTAQHLLSAVIWDKFRASTVGNQIHADYSHIDFHPTDLTMNELKDVEKVVNKIISKGIDVLVKKLPRSEVEERIENERVDLSRLPVFIKELRTVFIGDEGTFDLCPCAGTHVKNLSELKGIEIIKRKSKGSGKVRVQYKLL
jgi:misacylated tRNA(Ala) deacylase